MMENGGDPRSEPVADGDEHDPADWGAWLRGRLERVADLEATPDEAPGPPAVQEGEQRPASEKGPEHQGDQPDESSASPGPDSRVAEELAALRAAVAALPPGPDSRVAEELAALRTTVDGLGDRLDHLMAAIVDQGRESGERLDQRVTTLTEKLDDATATLAEQQRASRGAISEVLDHTSDATASLRELSSALSGAAPGVSDDAEVLEALRQVGDQLAAGSRATEAQAAELAVLGDRLGRLEEVLDRLVAAAGPERPESGVDPGWSAPPVVELDDAQAAIIADAVAGMLLDTAPTAPSSGHDPPEQPPAVHSPPAAPTRRRPRSAPLRAVPRPASADGPA